MPSCPTPLRRPALAFLLLLLLLGPGLLAANSGDVIISEFMADNQDTLRDGNGNASDWIELCNTGTLAVDLAGWSLTEDPLSPSQWIFPSTTLEAGQFLLVFASGNGIPDPAGNLHANFQLPASGGYLALVRPDGSIATDFSPSFPPQRTDVSYGISQQDAVTQLITAGTRGRALIPGAAQATLSWRGDAEPFADGGWLSITNPVGYDSPAAVSSSLVNVALGRPVSAAGDQWPGFPKENLTDGSLDTFTHNAVQVPDFWFEVDLGATYKLENIELFNRKDGCCPERLMDYTVSLIADANGSPGETVWSADARTNNSNSGVAGKDTLSATNDPSGLFAGRWIRVAAKPDLGARYFQIAELRANAANWARSAVARASGATVAGQAASSLVDGNLNTVGQNLDLTNTFAFQIRLPQPVSLTRLDVVNRADGVSPDRLSNYRVSILSDNAGQPGAAVWSADVRTDNSNSGAGGIDALTAGLDTAGSFEGQWIQIQNLDLGVGRYLQVAEVRAFGFAGGSGYGTLIRRDLTPEMRGINASAWIRLPFTAAASSATGLLTLRMRYDDGFVAWLNGTEVAQANAPAGNPSYNSRATGVHFASIPMEFALPSSLLREGTNILAVHGLNFSPSDSDFLQLPELISRARLNGGYGYLLAPTPGILNSSNTVAGFVESPRFSPDRGYFDAPLDVVITSPTPGATLAYTTNSSRPSLTNGVVLVPADGTSSLTATVRVSTSTILRAAGFLDGLQPTRIDTHTYLFLKDVVRQPSNPPGFPAAWNGFTADYAMDPRVVTNAAYASEVVADMRSIPTLSIVLNPSDLFGAKDGIYTFPENLGDAWERAASVELIRPDGGTGFQEDCGIRIWGTGWRPHSSSPKHAMQLKFQDQYGAKKLHYPFFPDAPFAAFDNLVLRAQGSRSWCDFRQPDIEQTQYIHDAFARDSARDMGMTDGHATFVHLYLNGLYWGLYNPVEKTDEGFAETNLGGDKSEYDVITRRFDPEADAGDLVAWNTMMAIANAGVATPEQYALIQQYLDVDDLIDYMMFQQYATNHDGPTYNGNNMRAIRRRTPEGRFRFFFWDMEYTMWYAQEDNLSVDLDLTPARLYQKLRANPEFRLRWADHAQRHLLNGGALTPAASIARWSARAQEIRGAVVGESARWGDVRRPGQPYTRDAEWTLELNRLLNEFFPARSQILLGQYKAEGLFPAVEAPSFNRQGGEVTPGFEARIDAAPGTVYFTLDGSDPRLPGGGISPSATSYVPTLPLVSTGTPARIRVPKDGSLGDTWKQAAFNDAGWDIGTNGAGYDLASVAVFTPVPLQNATADFSEAGRNIGLVLDANTNSSGWGLLQPDFVNKARGAVAVFETASDVGYAEGTLLRFQLRHGASGQGSLGKFRLSVTRDDRNGFADGKPNGGDVTANWIPITVVSATSSGGATLTPTPDGAILASGATPATDTYTITALTPLSGMTGIRIEALEDSSLPNRGPGRSAGSGYALLTDFSVQSAPATLARLIDPSYAGLADTMHGVNSSLYLRFPLSLDASARPDRLILRVRYNDGFVAHLNGTEIARRNVAAAEAWNSAAAAERPRGLTFTTEEIDVSAGTAALLTGGNVLAIQALSASAQDADFFLQAELIGKSDLPIAIADSATLKARAFSNGEWSALNSATFTARVPLRITEIMHHPPDATVNDGDDYQFVELQNTGSSAFNLGGLAFTAGIKYIFPAGGFLQPGQFLVLARNPARFASRYPGVAVFGGFTGRLGHGSDTLTLARVQGGTVLSFSYSDGSPWPATADGLGFSLVPRSETGSLDPGNGAAWRASAKALGSPGSADPEPSIPGILINEIVTAATLPRQDAIELFNPTSQPVDVGGWFLSDDRKDPWKFRIPGPRLIPAHGFLVIDALEYGTRTVGGVTNGFELSASGESVEIFSADAAGHLTGYSHGFTFGASAPDVSFGRHLTSTGEEVFPAQTALTLNAANSGPRVGPVVFSEIQYHPAPGADPFVELRNITGAPVPLFDPLNPANTWRIAGLGFVFPTGLTLPANGQILVVASDPDAFRARYGIGAGIPVVGPYAGQLQGSGERLELQRPGIPTTAGVPMITVDEVRYNDRAPWPEAADGFGPSIHRISPTQFGNDPINWVAAAASPGAGYLSGTPPRITQQPAAVTAVRGSTVQLNVGAVGQGPLHFQWRFKGNALTNGSGPTLVLGQVQDSQAGSYQVTVFNDAGAVNSEVANLLVLTPPLITLQPQGKTVAIGTNVTFSVSASGSGVLSYQWRFNGVDIPGANSSSLSLTNLQPEQSGSYTVLVRDAVASALSQPALLSVLVRPSIVQGLLSQSAAPGETVSFVVGVAGSPPFTYRWRVNGSVLLTTLSESRTAVFSITNVQVARTGSISVSVSNGVPGLTVTSSASLSLLDDTDADGLPDIWETLFGFNPASAGTGALDPDQDGMSNLAEYIAGTDPNDPRSVLRIDSVQLRDGAGLVFLAVSNKTYSIEFTEQLGAGAWKKLTDVPASPTTVLETVHGVLPSTNRYYRLVVPARP